MRKLPFLLAPLVGLVVLLGCTNPATSLFRAEQTTVDLVHGAYVGYTNALLTMPISVTTSNAIRDARLKFGATALTFDDLREVYETNSAVKPQIQAILDSLTQQSTNIVQLINLYRVGAH